MPKSNLKAVRQIKPKAKRTIIQNKSKETSTSQDLSKIWISEISQLKSKRYKSVEEACEVLIELVMTRLKTSKALREQTKEFLKGVILTDPEFSEELKCLVD